MFGLRSLRHVSLRASARYGQLAVLPLLLGLWIARTAHAEPSLAQLLAQRPAVSDPTVALAEQLAEIARRPFASEAATAQALQRVRAELAALRAARASGVSEEALQRQTALVWAALSWADRLEARARTAARQKELAVRAGEAEAALSRARQSYERACAARSEQTASAKPDEVAR